MNPWRFREKRLIGFLTVVLLLNSVAFAKKEKETVPEVVVKAQSVAVLILPDARESVADPNANRKAQEEVEKALTMWGRYRLTQESDTADLVIAIRKGTRRAFDPTVGGRPSDTRPGTIETTDNTVRIGVQKGKPIGGTGIGDTSAPGTGSTAGVQTGETEDVLEVFLGGAQYNTDNPPLWVYRKKDGLNAPTVSAVTDFRKAVEEAEKALAEKQKKQKKNP